MAMDLVSWTIALSLRCTRERAPIQERVHTANVDDLSTLLLTIDRAASFERRKTALSWVSMTLSQSSGFSCNTPPLNDTLPIVYQNANATEFGSTWFSAGSNPARLVTSTFTATAAAPIAFNSESTAGSFRRFVQTPRRQRLLGPIRAQCHGQFAICHSHHSHPAG